MDTLPTGLSLVALVSTPACSSRPEGPAFSVSPEFSVISYSLEPSPSPLVSPHEGGHTHVGWVIPPQSPAISCYLKGGISALARHTGLPWSGPGLLQAPALCEAPVLIPLILGHMLSASLPLFTLFMQVSSSISFFPFSLSSLLPMSPRPVQMGILHKSPSYSSRLELVTPGAVLSRAAWASITALSPLPAADKVAGESVFHLYCEVPTQEPQCWVHSPGK